VIKYRAGGAQRWIVLGRHGEITAEQARAKAVRLRGAIANGEDPARVRDERAAEPTVDQFADRYLEEYAEPHKRPRSVEEDRRNLKLHIRPELGHLKVGSVNRQDVLKLHHQMRATPGAANRVQALLSKMSGSPRNGASAPRGAIPVGASRNSKRARASAFCRPMS
jgi:Arm DNA-binding domain/Phage integrase, N-terminal SAM-like domain